MYSFRCIFILAGRITPRWVVLLVALIVFVHQGLAANYYVDYSTGSDTNNGISTATAWQHCPGDPTATGLPAATTLKPGDTVYFKGGVVYHLLAPLSGNVGKGIGTAGILVSQNGTSGKPITYDGNSSGEWGVGRAILTDDCGTNRIVAFSSTGNMQWVNFSSFEIGPIGGSANLPPDPGYAVARNPGWGIATWGAMDNVVIDNCYFHNLGYSFNTKPMDANSISGCGIQFVDCSGVIITNCEFTHMNIACEMVHYGVITNLYIEDCKFHDNICWCVDLAPLASGASMDSVYIRQNQFYNYFQFDSPQWAGYGEWPHTDGIFERSDFDYCSWGTNINISGNWFWATNTVAGGTASIYITEGGCANIYNNVFDFDNKTRGSVYFYDGPMPHGSPQTVNIFNNTFVCNYDPPVQIQDAGTGRPVQTVNVENNIFFDTMQGSGNNWLVYIDTTNTLPNVFFDYDDYVSFNTSGKFFDWPGLMAGNLGQVQSFQGRGWESHGMTNNPAFVDLSYGVGGNVNSNNLHLQSVSSLRSKGTNLSSYFNIDKDGNARPPSGAWDIGAYQYQSSLNKVSPPEDLHIVSLR